jgi:hypothetical protein
MDFSSFYTNIMLDDYPIGELKSEENLKELKTPIDYGFYDVEIYSEMDIPILPYRCPKTKKLLFPNGTFRAQV